MPGTKKKHPSKTGTRRRWSARVMQTSDALDLKQGIFSEKSPKKIARSLKQSAEKSHRRKSTPFRSAMSMLNFYINRGGKNLSTSRKTLLNRAKEKLRQLYGKKA
jgi:hypothetical protein